MMRNEHFATETLVGGGARKRCLGRCHVSGGKIHPWPITKVQRIKSCEKQRPSMARYEFRLLRCLLEWSSEKSIYVAHLDSLKSAVLQRYRWSVRSEVRACSCVRATYITTQPSTKFMFANALRLHLGSSSISRNKFCFGGKFQLACNFSDAHTFNFKCALCPANGWTRLIMMRCQLC